jgi:adenosylcobinamide-phosphate synthase
VKAALVLLLAVALDVTRGEPRAALHPVVWMGKLAGALERHAPTGGRVGPLIAGVLIVALVAVPFALAGTLIARLPALLEVPVAALVLKTTFALRALGAAGAVVRRRLDGADLPGARAALSSLCSRDPARLDGEQLAAATVESLAENASDSFVAPLFFYVLLGLPGALFYRAVNTLDAMIGYRGRYEYLGKAAARLDDVLNFVPARLTAFLLLAAGALAGGDVGRGWRVLLRDGASTASPNAGRPMAAMAGLLGVELEKLGHYRLGDPVHGVAPASIGRAWRLVKVAAALTTALAAGAVAR